MEEISRQQRKFKDRFKRIRDERVREGANTAGKRDDSSGSLLRPDSRVAAGGHDGEGSRTSTDVPQLRSRGQSQQKPVPTGGNDDDLQKREANVDEKEVSQRDSHLKPAVVVGSGLSREAGKVEPSSSVPSIPHSGKPDDNTDTPAVPDQRPEDLHSNESAEPNAAANKKSNWRSTASATAELVLRGVRDTADAFGPLKSVAGGLCFILENCERTKANTRAIELLAPRVKALAKLLCEPVPEADIKEGVRRMRLEQKLQDVCQALTPLGEQGEVEDFFNNVQNADNLGGLVEDIHDAIMDYQTSLQQDNHDKSCRLIGSMDLALLHRMDHATDAGYRSGNRKGCLRGTRQGVLWEIERWVIDEQGRRVFWLNGLAGTGKSTIAQTVAETTFADGTLGATFFCSRDFADRSNIRMIFPTLAFQLAHRYPLFRKELLRVLKAVPDVGRESLCSQMEKVIVGPLKATCIPTLIIIDALDECRDEEPASAILSILSRYVDEIPDVKFFITGRPEPQIRSGFRLKSLWPITEVFKLHNVKRSSVDSDIRLLFRTQLAEIAKIRSDCSFTQDWPNASDIEILCKKAAGLFIYVSTVVKSVASRHRIPTEQLERIISLPQSTIHEGRSGIDFLYTQILEQTVDYMDVDEKSYSHFKTIVGAVLLAFHPLSVRALSDLLRVTSIHAPLNSLHSLLLIPDSYDPDEPIRVFHKSFPDFLTDHMRCTDKRFFVEPTVHHVEILLLCLEIMKERLKRNICNLDDYTALRKVKNLSARRKVYIGDALEYACQFWTKHLLGIPSTSPHVEKVWRAIDQFFTIHLLHWIEVLVLTGNLGSGFYAMNDVEQWFTAAGASCKWTYDSRRFLLEYFDTIHDSPSHIYHRALPFCPSSSWLYEFYSAELLQEVKVVKGLSAGWGACSRTVSLDSCTLDLSCWNSTLAVGSKHGDIIVLDMITGSQIAILSGHTDEVNTLTFSSDGRLLVSGSDDCTVKLWDVQTGIVTKTFSGHTRAVLSVSISPDFTTIASGSDDRSICLWNSLTGECYCTIEQQDYVEHISFSPTDPQYLLSVCDKKVWQWDINGHEAGPTYKGSHVAFSSDGCQFVTCKQTAITVWNISSGVVAAEFQVASGDTRCCCFSPDGRLIAVAAGHTIYVWDITSSEPYCVETFIGHTGDITSLIFSTPSSLISATLDKSVKFWQIGTSPTAADMAGLEPLLLTSPIKSITLQAKDRIAISTDLDGVVRIWDLSTGHCKASVQTPAQGSCQRDAQLINNQLILVWHTAEAICIQDAEKGELLRTVDRPMYYIEDLRISEDGSKVFCMDQKYIHAWYIETGEVVGKAEFRLHLSQDPFLTINGSKVWVAFLLSITEGWDFETLGSSPVVLSGTFFPRPHLGFVSGIGKESSFPPEIEDIIIRKGVFQLPSKYTRPADVQWDGQYLVAGYDSGEVLILDCTHYLPIRDM